MSLVSELKKQKNECIIKCWLAGAFSVGFVLAGIIVLACGPSLFLVIISCLWFLVGFFEAYQLEKHFKELNLLKIEMEKAKIVSGPVCAQCGAAIPKDKNFCVECGEHLPGWGQPRKCAKCGAVIPDGKNFCVECGEHLPGY